MNFLPLKRKSEKNFLHLLTTSPAFESSRVLPGQAFGLGAKILLPCVVLEASDCQPDDDLGDDAVGVVTLTATVMSDTRKTEDAATADSLLSALNEILLDPALPETFAGLDDLPEPDWHLYEVELAGDDTQYDGDRRLDILTFRVICHELEAAS